MTKFSSTVFKQKPALRSKSSIMRQQSFLDRHQLFMSCRDSRSISTIVLNEREQDFKRLNEELGYDKESKFTHSLHYWIGNDSKHNEYSVCAMIFMQFCQFLQKQNIIMQKFREEQGSESETFRGYFSNGLEYGTGGESSAFRHVEINEDNNERLVVIKGRHPVISCHEKPFSWSSLTTDDAYIIEIGPNIYRSGVN